MPAPQLCISRTRRRSSDSLEEDQRSVPLYHQKLLPKLRGEKIRNGIMLCPGPFSYLLRLIWTSEFHGPSWSLLLRVVMRGSEALGKSRALLCCLSCHEFLS